MKSTRQILCTAVAAAFLSTSMPVPYVQAGEVVLAPMPVPGTMVNLSPGFTPAHLKGIVIHADNALQFDFLIDKGDGNLNAAQKQAEYTKLVKYFLASLTVPDQDQWVNLSPYENNRIIENNFGRTEMGRDLLAQDYFLKQITSSLMYPESGLGKTFWDKVYAQARQQLGHTNIPVNTFNKVWITPDEALVYESGNTAYVLKSRLKVMLEEDFLARNKNSAAPRVQQSDVNVAKDIMRLIILPALEKEVNEGKNFAQLRQIFSGMVLATWYKKALRESLLGKVYADKGKVRGVDQDPEANQELYAKYLQAFKKGVYNYIKDEVDSYTNQTIPRKYFAGGFLRNDKAMVFLKKGELNTYQGNSTFGAALERRGRVEIARYGLNSYNQAMYVKMQVPEPEQKIRKVLLGAALGALLFVGDGSNPLAFNRFATQPLSSEEVRLLADSGNVRPLRKAALNPRLTTSQVTELWNAASFRNDFLTQVSLAAHPNLDHEILARLLRQPVWPPLTARGGLMSGSGTSLDRRVKALVEAALKNPQVTDEQRGQAENNLRGEDPAQKPEELGGIDMNGAGFNMQIKRDGQGVPLPLAQQDFSQLNQIQGFVPQFIEIRPLLDLPLFSEFRQNSRPSQT